MGSGKVWLRGLRAAGPDPITRAGHRIEGADTAMEVGPPRRGGGATSEVTAYVFHPSGRKKRPGRAGHQTRARFCLSFFRGRGPGTIKRSKAFAPHLTTRERPAPSLSLQPLTRDNQRCCPSLQGACKRAQGRASGRLAQARLLPQQPVAVVHEAVDHAEDGEAAADDGEDVDNEAEQPLACTVAMVAWSMPVESTA